MSLYYGYDSQTSKKDNFFSMISNLSVNTKLIVINVVGFIVFMALWGFDVLSLDAIALKPANIFKLDYVWTFVTSMFMHGGIFHLLVNMITLASIGSLVQRLLGQKRYLYFYLASGLFAGIFFVALSFFIPNDYNAYAVGASGALFGLVGLLILLTPDLPIYAMLIPIPIKMKYAGPGFLILLWLISIAADLPVGNTAHLGGLIVGVGYGIYLRKKFPNKTKQIRRMFR